MLSQPGVDVAFDHGAFAVQAHLPGANEALQGGLGHAAVQAPHEILEQLLAGLWGVEFEGETRTVDAHVGRIRKKLGWQNRIKTIPRIGYRLEVEF